MTKPTSKRRNKRHPATTKRGADPTVPRKAPAKHHRPAEERALDQGLEESMAGSDPPSIVQPGKSFVGPKG